LIGVDIKAREQQTHFVKPLEKKKVLNHPTPVHDNLKIAETLRCLLTKHCSSWKNLTAQNHKS